MRSPPSRSDPRRRGDASYPNKPIRVIVGFAAGGGNDPFARLVGQKLSENIGQPVIIENKAAPAAASRSNTSRTSPPTAIR